MVTPRPLAEKILLFEDLKETRRKELASEIIKNLSFYDLLGGYFTLFVKLIRRFLSKAQKNVELI
jgi:hypothetical protein